MFQKIGQRDSLTSISIVLFPNTLEGRSKGDDVTSVPANTKCGPSAGLMPAHCLQCWANINP